MPFKKILLFCAAVILIADILSISYFRILDRFELVTLDFRYNLRLAFPQKINQDIALIEIGEDTLQFLGRWPLPRDYHATLVDVLKKVGARMVIFDILFCEPTGWDETFITSAKEAGNAYFSFAFALKEKYKGGLLEAAYIDAPLIEGLREAAKGVGFINKLVDIDGKVRGVPLFIKFKEKLYPSMALEAACDYTGLSLDSIAFDKNRFKFGDTYIPADENGMVLLNFTGRWADAFTHYSYLDILAAYQQISEGKKPVIDINRLKGKVCFVGLTATGTQELGPIPIEKSYPMLGIHANLFNMLTEKAYLKRLGRFGNIAVLIMLSAGLLFLILRMRPYTAFFVSTGAILLLFISSILLFIFQGLWIDIICPMIVLFGVYLAITINRYLGEIRVREKIQKELAVATSIQRCFLPAEVPALAGLDIAVDMKTAKEVGGDLYDFVKLGEDRLGIMIGDVSGKGVPAALFMSKVETLFRVYSKAEESPAMVISKLNKEIASDERSGLFTTLIYAVFDIKKKEVLVSDAGHLPLILARSNKTERLVSEEGMALGIMEDTVFADKTIKLSEHDMAVFYTDGVSEARDIKGSEFGIERLVDAVSRVRCLPAKEAVNFILNEVRRFQGKAVQHDDITIIIVKAY